MDQVQDYINSLLKPRGVIGLTFLYEQSVVR